MAAIHFVAVTVAVVVVVVVVDAAVSKHDGGVAVAMSGPPAMSEGGRSSQGGPNVESAVRFVEKYVRTYVRTYL